MALLSPQLVNLCVLPDSSLFRVVLGGPRPATSVPKILLMCLSILIFPLTTVLFLTPIQNTDYTTTQGICQGNIKPWLRFLKKSRNTSLSARKSVDYRTKHKDLSAGHRNFCARCPAVCSIFLTIGRRRHIYFWRRRVRFLCFPLTLSIIWRIITL